MLQHRNQSTALTTEVLTKMEGREECVAKDVTQCVCAAGRTEGRLGEWNGAAGHTSQK